MAQITKGHERKKVLDDWPSYRDNV